MPKKLIKDVLYWTMVVFTLGAIVIGIIDLLYT